MVSSVNGLHFSVAVELQWSCSCLAEQMVTCSRLVCPKLGYSGSRACLCAAPSQPQPPPVGSPSGLTLLEVPVRAHVGCSNHGRQLCITASCRAGTLLTRTFRHGRVKLLVTDPGTGLLSHFGSNC